MDLSLSQDDCMKSSKNAKRKVSWNTEKYLSNSLAHAFLCASYHHTNELENGVSCAAQEEHPRAA